MTVMFSQQLKSNCGKRNSNISRKITFSFGTKYLAKGNMKKMADIRTKLINSLSLLYYKKRK